MALGSAYRAVDNYVYDRVRHFLRRRHKVQGRGTRGFPDDMSSALLVCCDSDACILARRRGPCGESGRKAGCRKSARPV